MIWKLIYAKFNLFFSTLIPPTKFSLLNKKEIFDIFRQKRFFPFFQNLFFFISSCNWRCKADKDSPLLRIKHLFLFVKPLETNTIRLISLKKNDQLKTISLKKSLFFIFSSCKNCIHSCFQWEDISNDKNMLYYICFLLIRLSDTKKTNPERELRNEILIVGKKLLACCIRQRFRENWKTDFSKYPFSERWMLHTYPVQNVK